MTGLKPEVGAQYPAELSGGMMKRASLARAISLPPCHKEFGLHQLKKSKPCWQSRIKQWHPKFVRTFLK